MCGRYVSARQRHELLEEFEVEQDATPEELREDYNVAPTKPVYAVLTRSPQGDADLRGVRQLRVVRWGLVPSWAKDPSIGSKLINARVETVAEKPSYRKAFAARRCLLPADGFFEWYPVEREEGKKPYKQPYFIHPADGGIMAMAGLYEYWRDPSRPKEDPQAWLWTVTIITTSAEDEIGHIHERMPMTIEPERWADWLDPQLTDVEEVKHLLVPAAPRRLTAYAVSPAVNKVGNNGPELLDPIADEGNKGEEIALF
ncbi:SOS response-associated peptidase [Rhizohabitans arisaemae]|uniref:SOS response-associated peptidase n=1 Tax=Rhizohabitans arisaemae TaxID=2720610 RepID=UPI0024B0ADE6|nr:SOS response-associated peptidase [Rhizohabitans arisaemae]